MCRSWAGSSDAALSAHKTAVKNYCTDARLSDPNSGCRELCTSYRGECNAAAISYCDTVTADPSFCSCINSPAKKHANPECVDRKCYMYGYKTIASPSVCSIVDCSTSFDLQNIGGEIELTEFAINQSCGTNEVTEEEVNPEPVPEPTPVATEESNALVIGLSVGVGLFIVIVIVGYLAYRSSRGSGGYSLPIPGVSQK